MVAAMDAQRQAGRRRRPRLSEIGLASVVTVLALGMGELVLRTDYLLYESTWRVYERTHGLGETEFFVLTGDPELPYALSPGATKRFWWGATVQTNEHGYLGDASSSREGPNILVAGDSVSFGLGVQQEETFPALLRRSLPGSRIAVLAAPGYNTANEIAWIERVLGDGVFLPDVLVLQIGWNDYLQPTRIIEDQGYEFYRRIPTRTLCPARGTYRSLLNHSQLFFRANHVLTAFLEGHVTLYDEPDSGAQFDRAMERLRALTVEFGFEIVLLEVPYARKTAEERRFLRAVSPSIAGFANSVDLTPVLADQRGFWFDRLHPNAEGHRLVAESLLERLQSLGIRAH